MPASNRAIRLDGPSCVRARARKGLSREHLAGQSRGGLSLTTIKRLENGVPVYLDTARRLATLLEVPIAELVADPAQLAPAERPSDHEAAPATVAIVPFEVAGSDPQERWFADGLVEDVITRMGKQWFPIISRSSSFRYVGVRVDPRVLRDDLGADYLVEGSIRRAGDTLRLTARLTDTRSITQIWAESYDRPYREIFVLQDALVATIVRRLSGAILDKEVADRRGRDPRDLTAWEVGVRGSWYFHRRTKEANAQARELFGEALRRETALPLAWYGLAMTHQRDIVNQWASDAGRSAHAMKQVSSEFAHHCPDDAGLHIATAYVAIYSGDRPSAIGRLREAIEIDPNATAAYGLYGQALAMENQPDEAIEQFEVAMRLSPKDSDLGIIQGGIGLCHFVAERYDQMLHYAKLAATTHPEMPFHYGLIAVASEYLGDEAEARRAVQTMLALEPRTSVQGLSAIVAAVNPDVVRRYALGLERAGVPK